MAEYNVIFFLPPDTPPFFRPDYLGQREVVLVHILHFPLIIHFFFSTFLSFKFASSTFILIFLFSLVSSFMLSFLLNLLQLFHLYLPRWLNLWSTLHLSLPLPLHVRLNIYICLHLHFCTPLCLGLIPTLHIHIRTPHSYLSLTLTLTLPLPQLS